MILSISLAAWDPFLDVITDHYLPSFSSGGTRGRESIPADSDIPSPRSAHWGVYLLWMRGWGVCVRPSLYLTLWGCLRSRELAGLLHPSLGWVPHSINEGDSTPNLP